MAEVLERIHGGEAEWPISVPNAAGNDGKQLDRFMLDSLIRGYFANRPYSGSNPTSCFTENGSRFYVDVGDHPETTTPEDTSFLGTTASDFANERIMRGIMASDPVDPKGESIERPCWFEIHKRVMLDSPNSYERPPSLGCHESYAVDRESVRVLSNQSDRATLDQNRLGLLGVHTATRGIFLGVGGLCVDGSYVIAQKAAQATEDFSTGTTQAKPVVNMRNEPHADSNRWARIHLIMGDGNMNPWANRMKFGTTSLVLRLIEHGVEVPNVEFEGSLSSACEHVAKDPTLKRLIPLKTGESVTAIEIQTRLMLAATALSDEITLPLEEQWALSEWEKACAEIAQSPLLLYNRVEWVLKLQQLKKFAEKHGFNWDDNEMRQQERNWDLIDPRGTGMQLRETVWAQWMPPESLIVERMTQAPRNTRANIRGEFVRAFSGTSEVSVDWGSVRLGSTHVVPLRDPYQSENAEVSQLITEHLTQKAC